MSSKDLRLEDDSYIQWLQKNSKVYIDKTILIYGKRRSGKSVIVDEIMYLCKDDIPSIYVICKSVSANNPYLGKVPKQCIKSSISQQWVENFLAVQKNRAKIYNIANQMNILSSIFSKLNIRELTIIRDKIISSTKMSIAEINNSSMNYGKKKEQIAKIEKYEGQKLYNLYKLTIIYRQIQLDKLIKQNKLTKLEICAVNYASFRPHVMLIFDDCASNFKKWCKESPEIKEMFYNGRWYYITLIVTTQSDTEIVPEMRQNAAMSIYTTNQSAIGSFNRKTDAFPRYIKKRAELCIKRVFKQETLEGKNFKKLVYLDDDGEDPFYYTIADWPLEFRMGGDSLWKISDKLTDDTDDVQSNENIEFFNKYYNK